MKYLLKIFVFFWVVFWFYLGIISFLETPKQIENDKAFLANRIKPAVSFVTKFKFKNRRLPTYREFYIWEKEYYHDNSLNLKQPVDSLIESFGSVHYIRRNLDIITNNQDKFKKADWTKDFAISAWRGEWMEYYFSWNNSYDSNNYTWNDGWISLIIFCGIGLLPIIIWVYLSKKTASIQKNII